MGGWVNLGDFQMWGTRFKAWDRSLHEAACPECKGTGRVTNGIDGSKHSECPLIYWRGNGYPRCVDGVLRFVGHDLEHWNPDGVDENGHSRA